MERREEPKLSVGSVVEGQALDRQGKLHYRQRGTVVKTEPLVEVKWEDERMVNAVVRRPRERLKIIFTPESP